MSFGSTCENWYGNLFCYFSSKTSTEATARAITASPRWREECLVSESLLCSACCLIILPLCCWRTLKDTSDWIQVLYIPWKPIKKSPRIIIPVRCHDSFLFCSIFFSGFWVTQEEYFQHKINVPLKFNDQEGLNSGGTDASSFDNAGISGTLIQSCIGCVRSSDRSCWCLLWKTKDTGISVPQWGDIKS